MTNSFLFLLCIAFLPGLAISSNLGKTYFNRKSYRFDLRIFEEK